MATAHKWIGTQIFPIKDDKHKKKLHLSKKKETKHIFDNLQEKMLASWRLSKWLKKKKSELSSKLIARLNEAIFVNSSSIRRKNARERNEKFVNELADIDATAAISQRMYECGS